MTDMTPHSPSPASKPKPRPRPQVMKLTQAAAQRIAELTTRADSEIVGLRVGIKNGGCAGQSYTVEYAHDVKPTDEVVLTVAREQETEQVKAHLAEPPAKPVSKDFTKK